MADGPPVSDDLQTALKQLIADVSAGRESALTAFARWCQDHRVDIEFMAFFEKPRQN